MKTPLQQAEESMARRNEADIRMVQDVVGMICGGAIGIFIDMQAMRSYAHHAASWFLVLVPVVAATIGACLGYFRSTWRSGQ